jgi:hypothetical protein
MANHVRRLGGARSPELGKEAVVRAIRSEKGWCRWTSRRAWTRRTRWCGCSSQRQLNGGSSERRSEAAATAKQSKRKEEDVWVLGLLKGSPVLLEGARGRGDDHGRV